MAGLYALPPLAAYGVTDRRLVHAVLDSERRLLLSQSNAPTNLADRRYGKFRRFVQRRSPLRDLVCSIVPMRALEEVRGVAAARVVAAVTGAGFGPSSVVYEERDPMNVKGSTVGAQRTVPGAVGATQPRPASVGSTTLVNRTPEFFRGGKGGERKPLARERAESVGCRSGAHPIVPRELFAARFARKLKGHRSQLLRCRAGGVHSAARHFCVSNFSTATPDLRVG